MTSYLSVPDANNLTIRQPRLQAVDFFCGAGGMTHGLTRAGINVVLGIDIDPKLAKTYEANNAGSRFLPADIRKLQPNDLSHLIRSTHGPLLFSACAPCQYYSQINRVKVKSLLTADLLGEFFRFVIHFTPDYILLENVPLFAISERSPIHEFKMQLTATGYNYTDSVLECQFYGVPQTRRRYILLASRANTTINLPMPETKANVVRNFIGDKCVFKPILAGHQDETCFQHSASNLSECNLKRIGEKTTTIKRASFTDSYTRMDWDKPSPTITTRFNSFSNGRFGHPEQDRALSLREGASLQTFPLDYHFYSKSTTRIAKMIGNAVPPEFARRIGIEIIRHLNSNN